MREFKLGLEGLHRSADGMPLSKCTNVLWLYWPWRANRLIQGIKYFSFLSLGQCRDVKVKVI